MELIVAIARNGVIGKNNTIPWHVPEDLIRFKHMTMGNIIVMGRKTFESFPNGPLKNRMHVVLTRKPIQSTIPNVVFISVDKLRETVEPYKHTKKIFVIGGKEIYDLLFDYCDIFHITLVDTYPEGNIVFSHNVDYFIENYMLGYSSEWFLSKTSVLYKYYTFYKK
jgi:dihydrofolate reductase